MALTATERWAKGEREQAAEEAKLIARAREIAAGATLKFGPDDMKKALRAFVDFKKCSRAYFGDSRDFLQTNGVSTLFGAPNCGSCDTRFAGERAWANHMMSYAHFLRASRASHAAVMELRAHLHAFPGDEEDFDSLDYFRIEKGYVFRNLPGKPPFAEEPQEDADDVAGPWHAFLEDDENDVTCFYVMRDRDESTREIVSTLDQDEMEADHGLENERLAEAEKVASKRNRREASASRA